jgi:hypothetical protein
VGEFVGWVVLGFDGDAGAEPDTRWLIEFDGVLVGAGWPSRSRRLL